MLQNTKVIYMIWSLLFIGQMGYAQQINKDTLLKQFHMLDYETHINFTSEKIKTHNEEDIKLLLNIYFKQIEILSQLKGEERLKFAFHKFRGGHFKKVGLYEESNYNYHLAHDYFYKITDTIDDSALMHGYLGYKDLASNYITLNKVDSAIICYKESIKFSNAYKLSSLHISSAYNDLGMLHRDNLQQLDSAMYYFQKAIAITHVETDNANLAFRGSIRDNIANVHVEQGKLKQAKELFIKNDSFYNPENYIYDTDHERWLRAKLQIAETDLKLGAFKQVEQQLDLIESLLQQYEFLEKQHIKLRYYNVKEDLLQAEGQHRLAYAFTRKIEQLEDSIERVKVGKQHLWNEHLKTIALKEINKQLENKQLEKTAKAQRKEFWLQLLVVLLGIGASVFTFIFIRNRQHIKHTTRDQYIAEQELNLLALKKEVLQKEMELNEEDLSKVVTLLALDQQWTKALLEKIKQHKELTGRAKAKQLSEIESTIQQRLVEDDTTHELDQKIQQLSKSFYEKLQEKHPQLTPSEIKLCALIRLGVDIHEIALLQDINVQSIHQKRYRLKKKLALQKDEDLDVYLLKFESE